VYTCIKIKGLRRSELILPSAVAGSSGLGSWAAEAPPPPEGEGWALGLATCVSNSSMFMTDGKPKPLRLCMIMDYPPCKL